MSIPDTRPGIETWISYVAVALGWAIVTTMFTNTNNSIDASVEYEESVNNEVVGKTKYSVLKINITKA